MPNSKQDPNEGLPYERPGEPLYEKEGRKADVILAKRSAKRKQKKKRGVLGRQAR